MKNRCVELAALLLLLAAIGIGNLYENFGGVIVPGTTVTEVGSVKLLSPDMTFLTPGWGPIHRMIPAFSPVSPEGRRPSRCTEPSRASLFADRSQT